VTTHPTSCTSPDRIRSAPTAVPIRKDEIEIPERGLYVESWMPERRSRRRPLLFIHGELTGSWIWERYLSYFASRGWEGHALNLRNHFWSETTDIAAVTSRTTSTTSSR
jgi:pimeloyl-ACP methyl ester carboxylesterase